MITIWSQWGDIVKARNEISKIIGELVGSPVSCEGETGMDFTGKPKIDGVLAITTKNSIQIRSYRTQLSC